MKRSGIVLVAVLVITALAGMIAASLMFRIRAELAASAASGQGNQAHAAAMSGLQRALVILQNSRADIDTWYDNEDIFRNQLVCDDGANRWYFTIYAFNPIDDDSVRFGLTDEAAKININTASRETLLALPIMTDELADCLMDYLDRDDEIRGDGAEQEYYSRLPQPYLIKNGPLGTLEEILLVKGFSGAIVYGEDANFNGLLDPNEDDADESFPTDDGDGELNRGLRGSATAITYEPNVDNEGSPRIDINGDDDALAGLDDAGLPQQTVDFIRRYRNEGKTFVHPGELLNMRYQVETTGSSGRRRRGRRRSSSSEEWIESGVGAEQLPAIMDKLTASAAMDDAEQEETPDEEVAAEEQPDEGARAAPGGGETVLIGLVNVNTARADVLAALPGIDQALAESIVEARATLEAEEKTTIAWLFRQGICDESTFKSIAPYLTARGFQYRVQCIGFGHPCGQFRIFEAVVDLVGGTPRIAYLRDITRLGLPLALNIEQEER